MLPCASNAQLLQTLRLARARHPSVKKIYFDFFAPILIFLPPFPFFCAFVVAFFLLAFFFAACGDRCLSAAEFWEGTLC